MTIFILTKLSNQSASSFDGCKSRIRYAEAQIDCTVLRRSSITRALRNASEIPLSQYLIPVPQSEILRGAWKDAYDNAPPAAKNVVGVLDVRAVFLGTTIRHARHAFTKCMISSSVLDHVLVRARSMSCWCKQSYPKAPRSAVVSQRGARYQPIRWQTLLLTS